VKDTIEMLEAIGRDASLRHASTETLTKILEEARATDALTMAAASGDGSRLSEEFGHRHMHMPQISQVPAHEEEEDPAPEDDGSQPPQAEGAGGSSL
jgi:hypothetical protein